MGAGIHFCATCDGPFYKGAHGIVVVGSGNSAVEKSMRLTKFADQVTMLVRGDRLKANKIAREQALDFGPGLQIHYNTVVEAFEGNGSKLEKVRVRDNTSGQVSRLSPAAAFIFIGHHPNSDFVKDLVNIDEYGFILTGRDLTDLAIEKRMFMVERVPLAFETNLPGLFAAGDVRHGSTNQMASAVGEGAAAALSIMDYLKTV